MRKEREGKGHPKDLGSGLSFVQAPASLLLQILLCQALGLILPEMLRCIRCSALTASRSSANIFCPLFFPSGIASRVYSGP